MYLKHVPLQGAHNFRDLGGCPAADGRATRWGLLYRSDGLAALTAADWEILQQRKVKTIIDLRSATEAASAPVKAPEDVVCAHFSLMNQLDSQFQNISPETILQSMKLDYVKTLFDNLPCAADILNTILERMEAGAVVFLCSAGKDRTGIVAALILYLCGVIREDIIADYMVSNIYNTNGINKMLSNIPEAYLKMIPDMNLLKECFDSRPERMIELLEAFEERDIRGRLAENGFSAEKQEMLRARIVE